MSVFPRGPMPMVIVAVVALTGCASAADFGAPRATGPDPVGFPECRSESYDFAARGPLPVSGSIPQLLFGLPIQISRP